MKVSLLRFFRLLTPLVLATTAFAQNTWTIRNPTPTDAVISQVIYGDDKFVAVGSAGTVLTSIDGTTWTESPRVEGRPSLKSVANGNNVFVALDENGMSYTSPDGQQWTKRTSSGAESGTPPLAFGNGIFLTKSAGNLFASSTDGQLWTLRTTGITLSGSSIAFDGTQFLVATGSRTYLTTTDGVTWTARSFPTGGQVRQFIAGDHEIVAELADGTIAHSIDGINWTVPATARVAGVGRANGRFFGAIGSELATSEDGLTWTRTGTSLQGDVLSDTNFARSIAHGAGVYVGFMAAYAPQRTAGSYVFSNPYTAFVTSTDGTSWTRHATAKSWMKGAAYGLGLFVAGDYLSSDGITWSPNSFGRSLYLDPTGYYYYFYGYRYAFCNDRFFALQDGGGTRVYTSTDGVTATLVATPSSAATAVAYGAGRYVLVTSSGGILTSTDAQTWTVRSLPDNADFCDLVYAHERFVAISRTGYAYVSIDGLTWDRNPVQPGGWNSAFVAYGNGRFLMIRTDSTAYSSTDGRTWTALPTAFPVHALEFANGEFLGSDEFGAVYTSPDGSAWIKNPNTHSSYSLVQLAFGNGQWIATSGIAPGTVVQSDTTSGPATTPVIVQAPASQTIVGTSGGQVVLVGSAIGTGPFTYKWYRDGVLLTEETAQTLVVPAPEVAANAAHDFRVEISGPGGSATSSVATVTVLPPQPPVIATQPADATPAMHETATFSVVATGTGPFTYQWYKNGEVLVPSAHHLSVNAKSSTLTLDNVSPVDDGDYTVMVTGRGGSALSRTARLTVNHSRLVNLSARARIGTGEDALFVGFVLANDNAPASAANAALLVRGIGPGLADKGIANFLSDPTLNLYQNIGGQQTLQSVNNDWGDNTGAVGALYLESAARVGAFELAAASKDSALVRQASQRNDAAPQVYSVALTAATGPAGVALAEVYDAAFVHARLMNLSARARVGSGEDVLTAGFVIRGKKPLRVLLRGVGPALGPQGVEHPLADPKLTLFDRHGGFLAANEDWGQNAEVAAISAATAKTGAFALAAGSKDAVLLLSLDPGIYTLQVSSQTTAGGVALVEIYEVP